jgi:hypothetical protein
VRKINKKEKLSVGRYFVLVNPFFERVISEVRQRPKSTAAFLDALGTHRPSVLFGTDLFLGRLCPLLINDVYLFSSLLSVLNNHRYLLTAPILLIFAEGAVQLRQIAPAPALLKQHFLLGLNHQFLPLLLGEQMLMEGRECWGDAGLQGNPLLVVGGKESGHYTVIFRVCELVLWWLGCFLLFGWDCDFVEVVVKLFVCVELCWGLYRLYLAAQLRNLNDHVFPVLFLAVEGYLIELVHFAFHRPLLLFIRLPFQTTVIADGTHHLPRSFLKQPPSQTPLILGRLLRQEKSVTILFLLLSRWKATALLEWFFIDIGSCVVPSFFVELVETAVKEVRVLEVDDFLWGFMGLRELGLQGCLFIGHTI